MIVGLEISIGGVLFIMIIIQFQELEELGYHAFAFGTYGDAVEMVGTTSALKCCSPQIVQYLSAVLIAGKYNILLLLSW